MMDDESKILHELVNTTRELKEFNREQKEINSRLDRSIARLDHSIERIDHSLDEQRRWNRKMFMEHERWMRNHEVRLSTHWKEMHPD